MRAFLTCAVLSVTIVTINAAPAAAQPGRYADLVDSWYHRYLGRHVDPAGLRDHVHALRHGAPADIVEAAILSSPEYYIRNGSTPEGFIAALHRDVLGRRAGIHEFTREVHYLLRHGRNAAALRVLSERHQPIVVASAPVVMTPLAPVYVPVAPVYRPAPAYVAPRSGISIRIGIR